jgi:hypothetical protein
MERDYALRDRNETRFETLCGKRAHLTHAIQAAALDVEFLVK